MLECILSISGRLDTNLHGTVDMLCGGEKKKKEQKLLDAERVLRCVYLMLSAQLLCLNAVFLFPYNGIIGCPKRSFSLK